MTEVGFGLTGHLHGLCYSRHQPDVPFGMRELIARIAPAFANDAYPPFRSGPGTMSAERPLSVAATTVLEYSEDHDDAR